MAGITHPIPELDRQGLRHFGLITGGIVAVLFGLIFPLLLSRGFPVWPWVIFAALAGWGLVAPQTLRPVYRAWMKFGLLLSKITTPIILGVVFFVVIAPMAAVMRIARHDPMSRKLDAKVKTYRVRSRRPRKEHMERPF